MKFFPNRPKGKPTIYGYTEPFEEYKGWIKVGYTSRKIEDRMKEHYPTSGLDGVKRYKILFEDSSMRDDGTFFKDYEVHKVLENSGFERSSSNNEWFKCSVSELKAAVNAVKQRENIELERVLNFSLRPEQREAINITKKCLFFIINPTS